jgi:endonuclease III
MIPARIDNRRIGTMLKTVAKALEGTAPPVVSLIAEADRDPYKVLISTILSARTKDSATAAASARLFAVAPDPEALSRLSARQLEKLIHPVGFYRTKARNLVKAARMLLDRFGGRVPAEIEQLIEIPGVGRKTANLVLTEAFQKDAICVDTHVHRILNIWGYLETADPLTSEMQLRGQLPRKYWQGLNGTLVSFGQQICVPVSPRCSECPVVHRCPRLGVVRSR